MKKFARISIRSGLLLLLILCFAFSTVSAQQSDEPVVYAVLFYSPTCSHCHQVINVDLPTLMDQYQGILYIMGIDISSEVGSQLYNEAIEVFGIPDERLGVPALYIGDTMLVGSQEIPEILPGIVEDAVKEGKSIDWPDIPTLLQILADGGFDTPDDFASTQTGNYTDGHLELVSSGSWTEKFSQDLAGNILSVIVLLGLVTSIVIAGIHVFNDNINPDPWPTWVIPAIVVVGLGVAGYLSYVELNQTSAICGPVGNCNAVQTSDYAFLFGIIPIGVMGVAGYLAIGAAWLIRVYGPEKFKYWATTALWGFSVFGIFFSTYLTFLEPFVIGATCIWCLSSAVMMALMIWASTPLYLEEEAKHEKELLESQNQE
ncbi:MAG: hypothetical protein JXA19_05285 [Anaerolineales bacterium]|nr:hypothetical protein [Anaerolineales bacterium]